MAFLAPWFLLGLVAVAGPLVAHLRRLHVQKRVSFSAVEFIEPLPPRSARRSWEDMALMAARIAVVGLLSLAFARPYLPFAGAQKASGAVGRRLLFLVDTSASMRRGRNFEEAKQRVLERAASAGNLGGLEVRTFDRAVRTVLPFALWQRTPQAEREALLKGSINALEPGWSVARLDEALRALAEQHASEAADASTEVVLVSDFQEGSSLLGLQGYEWPQGFSVTLQRVGGQPANAPALRWLPPDQDSAPSDAPCKIQVLMPVDATPETLKLRFEGTAQSETVVPVAAGKPKVVVFPFAAAHGRVSAEGFDDFAASAWVARVPQRRALVALAGGASTGVGGQAAAGKNASPYFVRRALEALGEARVECVDAGTLPVARDAEVVLWVVCPGTDTTVGERVRAFVARGGAAMVLLGGESDAAFLHSFAGLPLRATEKPVEGFAALGGIAREHPLFAPFQAPQFSDFTSIRFWKYRKLEIPESAPVEVLARFEGGDPALLELRPAAGRVLVWASDWRPADGQWVLSSRCVPFVASCVEWAAGGRRELLTGAPGDRLALPSGSTSVRASAGAPIDASGGAVVLEQPGVYTIEPGGGTLVVNVAPEETASGFLPEGKLEALGVPVHKPQGDPAAGSVENRAGETAVLADLESRQGGWRAVLAVVLGLLVLETLWAAKISQQRKGTA